MTHPDWLTQLAVAGIVWGSDDGDSWTALDTIPFIDASVMESLVEKWPYNYVMVTPVGCTLIATAQD